MLARSTAALAVIVVLLGTSGCANPRTGIVWGADGFDRTVTIGDEIFQVTAQTKLRGADGSRILFDGIPTAGDPSIGLRNAELARVRFEPELEPGSRELRALHVIHRPRSGW